MHTILHLESDWLVPNQDQSLKQTLIQPRPGSLPTNHHRSKLQMIPHQNNLFRTFEHRQQTLRLNSLCGLINQHMIERQVIQSLIRRRYACRTDNIGLGENLFLGGFSQLLKLYLFI